MDKVEPRDDDLLFLPVAELQQSARPARAILPHKVSRHFITLADLWLDRLRQSGAIPTKADMDVLTIAGRNPLIVPHLWLLDVERDPPLFRMRVMGGALVEGGAKTKIGQTLQAGQDDQETIDRLWRVVETPAVHYRAGSPRLEHIGPVTGLEMMCLPLRRSPESGVDLLLNCTVYRWQEGYRGG